MERKKQDSSTYKHILKYTGLLGGVQMITVLISVVRNKLTAELVGSIGMGLYDLYGRTLELLGNATNFGISLSAVRRLSKLYERNDEAGIVHYVRIIRTWSLLTSLLGLSLCLLSAPYLSRLTMG
ncbi:MAG: oligosaccharide flippase family protein, partial [Bacteroidaceae bacterium]|nr:oligosaccharide flippase family protein [Bacteroidaceae bacterium]